MLFAVSIKNKLSQWTSPGERLTTVLNNIALRLIALQPYPMPLSCLPSQSHSDKNGQRHTQLLIYSHNRYGIRHPPYGITECYLLPDTSERAAALTLTRRWVLDLPTPEGWKAELTLATGNGTARGRTGDLSITSPTS